MNKTTCASDPFPTKLLTNHFPAVIDIILHIINLSIFTCIFPSSCKYSIVIPLINLFSTNKPYMEHHFHELTIAQWFEILELSMHCYIKYILNYIKILF